MSALFGCALIWCLGLAGCGYSTNGSAPANNWYQWKSLYRQDVRSVAVPIFTNKSYRRGVEYQLSKALVGQIELHTPYKVVPRERADTILEGEIVDIHLQNVSRDPRTALPQEQLYVIRTNFRWKDLRTGQVLTDRENFEQTVSFFPVLGEDAWAGSQDGVERLALGIVQEMQANW